MIPNPWVILGGVLALIGVALGGYFYGCHVTNVSRDASALADQLKATEHARQIEQDWQAKLDASQSQLAKERQDAQARESSLRADIDSGARKLRIAIVKQRMSGNSQSTSGGNDTTAELAPEARRAYSDLRAAISQDEQSLKACQGFVRSIGAAP